MLWFCQSILRFVLIFFGFTFDLAFMVVVYNVSASFDILLSQLNLLDLLLKGQPFSFWKQGHHPHSQKGKEGEENVRVYPITVKNS